MYFQIYSQVCSPSSSFFKKLWLTLLLNMQNNENNYEEAEREEREKKKKKVIFNSKKEIDKGSFIYDVHKKCLKLWKL